MRSRLAARLRPRSILLATGGVALAIGIADGAPTVGSIGKNGRGDCIAAGGGTTAGNIAEPGSTGTASRASRGVPRATGRDWRGRRRACPTTELE